MTAENKREILNTGTIPEYIHQGGQIEYYYKDDPDQRFRMNHGGISQLLGEPVIYGKVGDTGKVVLYLDDITIPGFGDGGVALALGIEGKEDWHAWRLHEKDGEKRLLLVREKVGKPNARLGYLSIDELPDLAATTQ